MYGHESYRADPPAAALACGEDVFAHMIARAVEYEQHLSERISQMWADSLRSAGWTHADEERQAFYEWTQTHPRVERRRPDVAMMALHEATMERGRRVDTAFRAAVAVDMAHLAGLPLASREIDMILDDGRIRAKNLADRNHYEDRGHALGDELSAMTDPHLFTPTSTAGRCGQPGCFLARRAHPMLDGVPSGTYSWWRRRENLRALIPILSDEAISTRAPAA